MNHRMDCMGVCKRTYDLPSNGFSGLKDSFRMSHTRLISLFSYYLSITGITI